MTIYHVDPWLVILLKELPPRRDVKHQFELLAKQGQIEPLLGRRDGGWIVDNSNYAYAVAQVWAARGKHEPVPAGRLSPFEDLVGEAWPTIIVTDEKE